MSDIVRLLLLLSLLSAAEGERHDQLLGGCSSHCSSKHDQSLSCWNRTANFFSKTLMSVFLRHVTTQRSIDRMMEYVRSSNNTSDFLTTELINKTVMAFVSASFKTISAKKQPALLSCPRGCEKPSEFWLLWSSISMMISGILTVVIIIKTLAMDRSDQKYASVEETVENDKRKAN